MNAQYLHVSQFYQAILCFSLLILIIQKTLILVKGLDGRYLKSRTTQFEDQIYWKPFFQTEKQLVQMYNQSQLQPKVHQQNNQPKNQTLRTSFIDKSQQKQTQRNFIQGQQQPKRMSEQVKNIAQFQNSDKSSPGIMIERQKVEGIGRKEMTSQKYENKNQQTQQAVQIEKKKNLNLGVQKSFQNKVQTGQIVYKKQNQQKTKKQYSQKQGQQAINYQNQPQLTQDSLQKQYKDKQKIRYFKRIDSLFNQYFSILIPVLVVGILVGSTYIFSMVCFFGFIFCSLLFNYANLLSRLKSKSSQDSILKKSNKLISGIFILALFISYWADSQFM